MAESCGRSARLDAGFVRRHRRLSSHNTCCCQWPKLPQNPPEAPATLMSSFSTNVSVSVCLCVLGCIYEQCVLHKVLHRLGEKLMKLLTADTHRKNRRRRKTEFCIPKNEKDQKHHSWKCNSATAPSAGCSGALQQ